MANQGKEVKDGKMAQTGTPEPNARTGLDNF
jgi:hypothetical protein